MTADATPSSALTYDDLTAAEKHVCDAVRAGAVADFAGWTEDEARLRAEFLQLLISSSEPGWPVLASPLRIRGARVTGGLTTPPHRHEEDISHVVLSFSGCVFDEPVDFSGAEFLLLRFVSCTMPAFVGAGLNVRSNVDFAGTTFSGIEAHSSELVDVDACSLHLVHARIGGRLNLSARSDARFRARRTVRLDGARIDGELILDGAFLDGAGDAALSARSMTVGYDVQFRPACGWRFKALGEVILAAARITGDLRFLGAVLFNPTGRALHCEDLAAESITLSDRDGVPFVASGRINFLSATSGGMVVFDSMRIWPGPDYSGLISKGGPVALNIQQLRVSNALIMSDIGALGARDEEPETLTAHKPVEAWFLLAGAELNSIVDDIETGWPAPGFLELQGATYVRINEAGREESAARRLTWLSLQFPRGVATEASYRSQPYEELSRVLRRHGRAREADDVAVEKIRQRLAARVERPWARLFPLLLMLICRHGYSSSRAALSFVVFAALGSVIYAVALWGFGQPFVPMEAAPSPTTYVLMNGVSVTHARGCPGWMLPHYALDAALPLVELGQTENCRFAPDGGAAWLWSAFDMIYRLAGAALSAVVVLTLTGLLRRD